MPAGWKAPVGTSALGTERIVWHNELTKGIFHKHVVDTQRITNYRVIHNNSEIQLKDVDDIVVMNQHRISQSSYMGTSTGRYARFGYGSSRSKGVSVGDVVFMYQGRPYIIFKQITDPHGVVRLAKSARKQLLTSIKAAERLQAQSQKQFSKVTRTKRNINQNVSVNDNTNLVSCPRCSSSNPKGSRYCNNCGFKIDNKIMDMKTGQSDIPSPIIANDATPLYSDDGNELRYISPLYKIKIDYPISWTKVEEGLAKPLVVAFTSPKENVYDRFLENVTIGILQVPKQITLDQFVQLNINDLKNKNSDLKILESSPASLCGVPAYRLVYGTQGRTYQNTTIIKPNEISNTNNNNTAYMILYLAETAKYPIYLPIAQKIINSFGFTG